MGTARLLASLLLASMVAIASVAAAAQSTAHDQEAIRQLARKTWERPDAPLSVDPIVVVGDHAISAWSQGDQGGRALLRRREGLWEVVLCSGDELLSAETAHAAGVPVDVAERLVLEMRRAERSVPPDRLAKFSLFAGIVRMDGAGPAGHHKH